MATTEPTTDRATERPGPPAATPGWAKMDGVAMPAAVKGVSAREAEVLALIGEHLSNAEIGARLYISVRTVESHVSALLRKLNRPDRRALAQLSAELAGPAPPAGQPAHDLPPQLTGFIGRERERRALRQAIQAHRQVTAVGPGGVGKTRLALTVAADAAIEFTGGVWYVDLVPISDPLMVGAAVAGALGIGEQPDLGMDESVFAALDGDDALVVLDNCEHLVDGVVAFVERLLRRCPRVTVLATSRARLMVPFERVYIVPPLSLRGDDGAPDALALFLDRAAATGRPVDPSQHAQVVEICRQLEGMALAIELAAARLPTLGLDGLTAGLVDHLRLLTGGPRLDERHRSVRAMLAWSLGLVEPADRVLLRRVSVFVAPFTAEAAERVVGFDPLVPPVGADGLARLADQSLLNVASSPEGTRYRVLESIRQYGQEQLVAAGDEDVTRSRHLRWCHEVAAGLAGAASEPTGSWRTAFDAVADELRAALGWALGRPAEHVVARELAMSMAELAFRRNLVSEAQHWYEQAAALGDDPAARTSALRSAAAVAQCRYAGDDAFRLFRAAAAAGGHGDDAAAAHDLARAALAVHRQSGSFSAALPLEAADELLEEARRLAGEDPAAQAAVLTAEALAAEAGGPHTTAVAERAVELARRAGDPLAESAALDALMAAQNLVGDMVSTAATARRRIELLNALPVSSASAFELIDALSMAVETGVAVGDLHGARRWGAQLRDLPMLAEIGHVASYRLLLVDALAGNVDEVLVGSERFLDAWQHSGREQAAHLGVACAAVAMIHGLRGDDDARSRWLAMVDRLGTPAPRRVGYLPTFDAIVALHRARAGSAWEHLAAEPAGLGKWAGGSRLWYTALRAEAAVLAGRPDAGPILAVAQATVTGNPVASAICERADALRRADPTRLPAIAASLLHLGARYQWARTLGLARVAAGTTGDAFDEIGLAPPGEPAGR